MYRKVKLLASVGPTPFKKQIIHDDGKNNLMLKTCPKTLKESNGHNESEIQKNYEKEDEIIDNKSKTEAKKAYSRRLVYCNICHEKIPRFSQHVRRKHKDKLADYSPEDQVKVITSMKTESTKVYNLINPDKILSRKDVTDGKPCPNCGVYYSKSNLYKHAKKCVRKSYNSRKLQSQSTSLLLLGKKENLSNRAMSVIAEIKDPKMMEIVKGDQIIKEYVDYLCRQYKTKKHLNNLIRSKILLLAKFLKEIKELNSSITNLEEVFTPRNGNLKAMLGNVYTAIENVGGLTSKDCRAPSTITQLGTLLKAVAERYDCSITLSTTMGGEEKNKKMGLLNDFIKVFNKDFNSTVGAQAIEFSKMKKWNKPRDLPISSDIKKFNDKCNTLIEQAVDVLKHGYDAQMYNQLNKTILCSVLSFNRRRVGETQRFLIVDYEKKRGLQKDSDEYQYLSDKEKESGNEYVRFEAKGKCIRGVPVLLTTKEAEYIDKFILKMRKYTNIVDDNPYVFATGETSLDGCYCMRSIRYECDAKYPELLTGTKLRKHLASSTQVVNLTAQEKRMVCDFMGHEEKIHDSYYRMSSDVQHITQMSGLLKAAAKGIHGKPNGSKSLREFVQKLSNPTDEPADLPIDDPADLATDESADLPTDDPADLATDESADLPTDDPADLVTDESADLPTDDPADLATDEPADLLTDDPENLMKTPKRKRQKRVFDTDESNDENNNYNEEIRTPIKAKRKKVFSRKVTWNTPERKVIMKEFADNIKNKTLPKVPKLLEVRNNNPILRRRTIMTIKTYLSNINLGKIKKLIPDS